MSGRKDRVESSAPATVAASPAVPHQDACATCGTALLGDYCHACGEKRLHRHDYTFAHFLEHTVDAVTHFDLRVLRDLWAQLRRPGWLAAEWLQGRRVHHAPPVQLFLVTNLLFYFLASASHFSPFATNLPSHFQAPLYGHWGRGLVEQYLIRSGLTEAVFRARFDEAAHIYSKSLVFVFVPLLAAPLGLMFWRQRRYFVEWLALNIYLFGGVLLLFGAVSLLVLVGLQIPATSRYVVDDDVVTPVMFVLTTIYNAAFFGQVFPSRPAWLRWGKATLYTFAFLVVLVYAYRLILFGGCSWAAT